MDYNEEKFKQHIKEVVAASDIDSDRPLSIDELRELALSMGLTDADWEKLQNEAKDHLLIAEKHLSARNYVDAVASADKATSINPYIKDGNSILAHAYLMQWIDDSDPAKRDKAEFFARKEVKVDPNDKRAISVLSTVQNKKRIAKDGNKIKKYIFIGIGIAFILALIGYMSNSSSSSDKILNQIIQAEEEVNAKSGNINAALDRRNNLIPDLLNALNNNDITKDIKSLQNQIKKAKGDSKIGLEKELSSKITEAKVFVGKNNTQKSTIIIEIEGAENRITYARKEYNNAVKAYNILIKTNQLDYPNYSTKPYFE